MKFSIAMAMTVLMTQSVWAAPSNSSSSEAQINSVCRIQASSGNSYLLLNNAQASEIGTLAQTGAALKMLDVRLCRFEASTCKIQANNGNTFVSMNNAQATPMTSLLESHQTLKTLVRDRICVEPSEQVPSSCAFAASSGVTYILLDGRQASPLVGQSTAPRYTTKTVEVQNDNYNEYEAYNGSAVRKKKTVNVTAITRPANESNLNIESLLTMLKTFKEVGICQIREGVCKVVASSGKMYVYHNNSPVTQPFTDPVAAAQLMNALVSAGACSRGQ